MSYTTTPILCRFVRFGPFRPVRANIGVVVQVGAAGGEWEDPRYD